MSGLGGRRRHGTGAWLFNEACVIACGCMEFVITDDACKTAGTHNLPWITELINKESKRQSAYSLLQSPSAFAFVCRRGTPY